MAGLVLTQVSPAQEDTIEDGARLLLFTTFWWPTSALLAARLTDAGFRVTMLCPRGHAAHEEPGLDCIVLRGRSIGRAMRDAIETVRPALVLPMDDRAVRRLHRLHVTADSPLRALIERSLGTPAGFRATASRAAFTKAATDAGLATPSEAHVRGARELVARFREYGRPLVLKVDGLTGGQGIAIVRTRVQAWKAYLLLRLKLTTAFAVKRWLVNRDPFWLSDRGAGHRSRFTVQRFVTGTVGDLAFFCLDGRLLGATVAESESRMGEAGPSTFVRLVERPDLLRRVARLIGQLGLSGFYGLDFIVRDDGEEVAIELNPRITALAAIRAGDAGSPIAAAGRALLGMSRPEGRSVPERAVHAHFPLAWRVEPHDPRLALCRDDAPWDRPRLLHAMLRPPWNDSGLLARCWAWTTGKKARGNDAPVCLSPSLADPHDATAGKSPAADSIGGPPPSVADGAIEAGRTNGVATITLLSVPPRLTSDTKAGTRGTSPRDVSTCRQN